MVFQKSPVVRSRGFFCFLENRPYLKDMTPPPRPLSPTRKATSIPSRRPPLRRRKLRLWMRPYSVPRFWRMIRRRGKTAYPPSSVPVRSLDHNTRLPEHPVPAYRTRQQAPPVCPRPARTPSPFRAGGRTSRKPKATPCLYRAPHAQQRALGTVSAASAHPLAWRQDALGIFGPSSRPAGFAI